MRVLSLPLSMLMAVLCARGLCAQVVASDQPRTPPRRMRYMQAPVRVNPNLVVREGTAVVLRMVNGINSRKMKAGDKLHLVLDRDLWAGDILVAKQGAAVEATVKDALQAKWSGLGSKGAIEVSGLRLLNGQILFLRATADARGGLASAGRGPAERNEIVPLECPLCLSVLASPAVVAVASVPAPRGGRKPGSNPVGPVWVDHDVILDVAAFGPFQPKAPTAKVQVVRGKYGYAYDRDLYCNGIPLAHLSTRQLIELELQPGWYRFAINPEKQYLELFLGPASVTRLITDYQRVFIVDNLEETGKLVSPSEKFVPDRSLNVSSLFGGSTSEDEYLQSARPVDARNIYSRECPALTRDVRAP